MEHNIGMSKGHSGKKVVIVLLTAMISTSAAVLWIGNSFGSQPGAESRRPVKAGGAGGSMWKNIDSELKAKQEDRGGRPGAPW